MKFKIITCLNQNMAIGSGNDLLYHIPNDLSNFKRMTINNVIVMGRKTYESLPKSSGLSNRINIILTTDEDYSIDSSLTNLHIVHSLEAANELCDAYYSDLDCYIIGGAQIYEQALEKDMIDEMYITTVNDYAEGEVFFPNVLLNPEWTIYYQSYTQRCRQENLTYFFTIYKKTKNIEE